MDPKVHFKRGWGWEKKHNWFVIVLQGWRAKQKTQLECQMGDLSFKWFHCGHRLMAPDGPGCVCCSITALESFWEEPECFGKLCPFLFVSRKVPREVQANLKVLLVFILWRNKKGWSGLPIICRISGLWFPYHVLKTLQSEVKDQNISCSARKTFSFHGNCKYWRNINHSFQKCQSTGGYVRGGQDCGT